MMRWNGECTIGLSCDGREETYREHTTGESQTRCRINRRLGWLGCRSGGNGCWGPGDVAVSVGASMTGKTWDQVSPMRFR